MPNYPQPTAQWLAQQLSGLKVDVAALKATKTQYVVDPSGVCQAIVGDITHDHEGNATGLTGWGIASFKTKAWVQL
jgi:hypothetical protein